MRSLGYHGHCLRGRVFRLHSDSPAWRECILRIKNICRMCPGQIIIRPCYCTKASRETLKFMMRKKQRRERRATSES